MVVYFHRVGLSGLSANAFVVPVMGLVVPVGFVALLPAGRGWPYERLVAGSEPGDCAMACLGAAEPPRSLTAIFTTRYGMPSSPANSSSIARMRSCSACESSGGTKLNISTLSNWCTLKIPRVSLPAAPASRRKHGEKPA